ncbi:MAG: heparan-alpha-glucosaminide N-acetyltransferase [Candidatus Aminicenantales bacterium]
MGKAGGSERVWEIDFLRGLAIILMVGYHLLFDLGEFSGVKRFLGFSTNLSSVAWTVAQFFFAGVFVVLSGISSTLSRNNIRRGLRLLAVSLLVTAATYLFEPTSAVYFGILQCLAVSMLVYGLAFRKAGPVACAAWGLAVFGLGAALSILTKGMAIRFDWLLPFGIHSPGFSSFDYFPLVPWFGIFLAGAALGKSIYASRRSLIPRPLPETFINAAGRYSLWIYIIHQPVIMGVLYLLGRMR